MMDQISAIAKAIPGIVRGINSLADRLKQIEQNQEKIMSQLDDAKAAMANLVTAVSAGTAEISGLVAKIIALLGAPTGIDPAAVEDLATQAQAQADAINAAVQSAKTQTGV